MSLPDFAVDALRAHQREQATRRLALGAEWKNALGLVFTTTLGRPLDPIGVTRMLKRRLRAAGLPSQRFHDLRHATYLVAQGIPMRAVSEILGHADPALTVRTYAHVLPGQKKDGANKLQALLAVGE